MIDPKDKRPEVKLPENVPVDYAFEKMLKSFIKTVEKSGVLQQVKARRYYIKKSALKRAEEKERRRK
jgi:ribosomal protein S21